MASVASAGASPLSGYEFPQTESTGDPEENAWAFVSIPNSASPGSVTFLSSPASAALGSSWGVIGHGGGHHSEGGSLPAASPLNLDTEQPSTFNDGGLGDLGSAFDQTSQSMDNQLLDLLQQNPDFFSPGSALSASQFSGKQSRDPLSLVWDADTPSSSQQTSSSTASFCLQVP